MRKIFDTFFPPPWYYIKSHIEKCRSVLDLGCGDYSTIAKIRVKGKTYIGADIDHEALIKSKRRKIHDDYIYCDIMHLPFKSKSIDAVLLSEVIEHLEKDRGTLLIDEIEKITKKKIILTTPNGFLPQEIADKPHQTHKSGWSKEDFKCRNYIVHGLGMLKVVNSALRHIPLPDYMIYAKHIIFEILLSRFFQRIFYFYPSIAAGLLCIKDLENEDKKITNLSGPMLALW